MAIMQLVLQNQPFCFNNFQLGNLELFGQVAHIGSYIVTIILPGIVVYHFLNLGSMLVANVLMAVAVAVGLGSALNQPSGNIGGNDHGNDSTAIGLLYTATIFSSLFTILPASIRTILGKILDKDEFGPSLSFFCLIETIVINIAMFAIFTFYEMKIHTEGGENAAEIIFAYFGVPNVVVMIGLSVGVFVLCGRGGVVV